MSLEQFSFNVVADLAVEIERTQDLYEACLREATLLGPAPVIQASAPEPCPSCGINAHAIWFRSRGWVCIWCEDSIAGEPPT